MEAQQVLIKKYENRRLYDATNSRYVNLDDVAQMVQRGSNVQVVDAASGEDITRMVLTQIIAEGAKASDSNFPLDILRQMVIASGRATQESALHYTKAMLDLYQSTYRAMAPALNPFEFMQKPMTPAADPRAGTQSKGGSASAPETAAGDARTSAAAPAEELSELKQRIADLERAISSLGAARTEGAKTRPAVRPAKGRRS